MSDASLCVVFGGNLQTSAGSFMHTKHTLVRFAIPKVISCLPSASPISRVKVLQACVPLLSMWLKMSTDNLGVMLLHLLVGYTYSTFNSPMHAAQCALKMLDS